MRKLITVCMIVFAMLSMNLSIYAQEKTHGTLIGTVIDKATNQPIAYATVKIEGTNIGSTSDVNGNYIIHNVPVGEHTLTASFSGYSSVSRSVNVLKDKKIHQDFKLSEQPIDLNQVVVTANRANVRRLLASSLVTIVAPTTMANTNSQTLSQGLRFLPGLRIEDNCQNCGFNQVRINGLEGPYSQVLIDSHPIMSALAGVYGLEQIPTSMIDRVEVIRGGGSALYGSNAVGGVINVITKEPERNSASVDYVSSVISPSKTNFSSWDQSVNMNASMVTEDYKAGITIFGQYHYRTGTDYDGDTFTDVPNLRNRSLGFNSFYKPSMFSKIKLEFHTSHEHRRGGNNLDLPPFRSDIAEFIRHFNNGGSLTYNLSSEDGNHLFEAYVAGQHIERISYYGGGDLDKILSNKFDANYFKGLSDEDLKDFADYLNSARISLNQYGVTKDLTMQAGAQYIYKFAKYFDLTLGAEYISDTLTDGSFYRTNPIAQKTRSLSQYHQLEYKTDYVTLLAGGRLDYTRIFQGGKQTFGKPIYSPRLNVRFNPIETTSIRLSYSSGFRAPQTFDEDLHVATVGGENVLYVLGNDLKEERSNSFSLSVDDYGNFGDSNWSYNVMAEAFYTHLYNKFGTVDSDLKNNHDENIGTKRTVENLGKANVYGINLEARIAYKKIFDIQAGYTWQRSQYSEAQEVPDVEDITDKDFMRTPNNYGYFIATYRPTAKLSFNCSGTFTGSMKVPHAAYEGQPTGFNADHTVFVIDGQKYRGVKSGILEKSKSFADIDLKANYDIYLTPETTLTVKAGVQNIFDSFQQDTDLGPGRASTYIYGPMLPRRVFVGCSINI